MDAHNHFTNEDEEYYPEVIIVFLFLLLVGCISGAAIALLIHSIVTGLII